MEVDIYDEDRWTQFVRKLYQDTLEDKVKWSISAHHDRGSDELETPVFVTELLPGKWVAVFRSRYKYWYDEEKYEWHTAAVVEMVDASGNKLWRLPAVSGIEELLETVQYKVADVEALFQGFMKQGVR